MRFIVLFVAAAISFSACNNPTNTTKIVVDTTKELPSQKDQKEKEMSSLEKPYHPEDNAQAKIDSLIKVAKKENKRIILQAGGNWCIWCLRFDNYRKSQPELMSILDQHFLYYHLNYSKENKNEAIFAKYKDPGQYGFPVFIVLDSDGTQLHTQESGSLEEGGSYSLEKVKAFFTKWIPSKKQ